jgi:outer membrane protein insertion porin family
MRGLRFILIAACAFCVLLAARHLAAQTVPDSFVVAEVHSSGSHRYSAEQVAATVGLKPGDPVNQNKLQEIADGLVHLGVFSRVNFRFTVTNRRATINFELEDAGAVPVMFENFPWFTDQELADEIRQGVPLFDGSAPRDGTLLNEITSVLSAKLASRGIKANVDHMLVAEPSSDQMIMQFRQDGPSFIISSLTFDDSLAQNSEKLKDRVSDLIGKSFSRFAIELFENEQLRPIYLATGQIGVKFGAPSVHFGANSDTGQQNPSTVDVQIPITPGLVYHLSSVNWNGNAALDAAALSKLLAVKPGDLANGMQLAGDWEQVELEYEHRGYLDVKATPTAQFDDAKAIVAYNVKIAEGPQYRMGQLVITGLSVDSEQIVRNSWQLKAGQVFDNTYLEEMLSKLEKPTVAIFGDKPVHYEKMGHFLRTNPASHVTDVLLDFQ